LSAAVLIYYANFYPFGGGAGDGAKYNQVALELSERFKQGDFSIEGFDKIYPTLYVPHFYPVFLAILYALTLPSMVIGICFNVWFVALSIVFLYLIVKEIGGSDSNAFIVGLIASVYPSYLYFGGLLIRDAILICFTLFALLFLIKLIKNFSWKKLLILSIAIGVVLHFRFYIGVILLFILVVSWFFINLSRKEKIKYGLCILLILGIFPQIFSGQSYFGLHFFQTFLNDKSITSLKEIANNPNIVSQEPVVDVGSKVGVKVGLDNPVKFTENITNSFFSIFIGPFPWQIKYSRQLFVLAEAVPWFFLVILIVASVVVYLKRKNYKLILPLLIFAFATFFVLSIFLDNFGTYTRIRIPAFLALLALADFSWLKLKFKSNVLPIFKNK